MRIVLTVIFSPQQSLEIVAHPDEQAFSQLAQAHEWLDRQWIELGCEPLRPSGKVLLLDKIMSVADALGYHSLQQNSGLAQQFAMACAQVTQAHTVSIDLPGLSVNY